MTVKSDHYGDYDVEYLTEVDYSKGVFEAGKIIDLYKYYFGNTLFSKWKKDWPDYYPKEITEDFPGQIEELYYPTKKSAGNHPLVNDRTVKNFKKALEKLKEQNV